MESRAMKADTKDDASNRDEVLARLSNALQRHPSNASPMPGLVQAIGDFATACRTDGDSPERVLIRLKGILTDARAHAPWPKNDRGFDTERDFTQHIISLCIESYYHTPSGPSDGHRS